MLLLICQLWTHLVKCGLATLPARTRGIVRASCNMFGIEVVAEAGSASVIVLHTTVLLTRFPQGSFLELKFPPTAPSNDFSSVSISCVLCISIMGLPGTRAASDIPRSLECKNKLRLNALFLCCLIFFLLHIFFFLCN